MKDSTISRRHFLLAGISLPLASQVPRWPGFRGRGTSITSDSGYPLHWSASQNILWRLDLPGYGQSSPVVWGDRAYLTCLGGRYKETLYLLSIGVRSGKEFWRREFSPTQPTEVTDMVSKAAPTSCVDAQQVYAFFETGELVALTHDGQVVWQRSLTRDYGHFRGRHGVGSSLRLSQSGLLLLAAHDGPSYLLCIDKSTGKNLWKTERSPGVTWTTPTLATQSGRELVLVSGGDSLEAYDAETGDPLWSLGGFKGSFIPSPTPIPGGAIIGCSRKGFTRAIRFPRDEESGPTVLWKATHASTYFCSPLAHRGHAYFVSKSGVGYCLDIGNGQARWTQRLRGQNWTSPIGIGDRIYFFGVDGITEVVAAAPEFRPLAENSLPGGGPVYGVAAVNGEFLIRYGTELIKAAEQS